MLNKKIAIIGAGKMGGALIKGLLSAKIVRPKNLMAADIDNTRLKILARKGIKTTDCNTRAASFGNVIILCVKPKDMDCVLREIASASNTKLLVSDCNALKGRLFISIAAGIKTDFIEKRLGKVRVVRVMPNTPAIIRQGMSAVSAGRFAGSKDEKIARDIFGSVGCVMKFPEKYMDAITALSGSGPAYFFFLMEALIEAGKKMGISSRDSLTLTLQDALGAAVLAKKSNIPPDKLRKIVTSPGGTTEAAFKVFGKARVKEKIIEGVLAAKRRSGELSING